MEMWYLLFLFMGCLIPITGGGGGIVTLESIKIYKSHEWIKGVKPIVYFKCKGEANRSELPDVKLLNFSYSFKGQESWQPLTELPSDKCKRCGFYEKDKLKSDDVYDEWEFCASDFDAHDGLYKRTNLNEFEATFFCPHCNPNPGSPVAAEAILISAFLSTLLILGLLAVYKYCQLKKREQDRARFLKLFEDGDDIEDQLGLANTSL